MAKVSNSLGLVLFSFVEQIIGLSLLPAVISNINAGGFTGVTATIMGIVPLLVYIAILISGLALVAGGIKAGKSDMGAKILGIVTVLVGVLLTGTINTVGAGTGPTGLANATFAGAVIATLAPFSGVFFTIGLLYVVYRSFLGDIEKFRFG